MDKNRYNDQGYDLYINYNNHYSEDNNYYQENNEYYEGNAYNPNIYNQYNYIQDNDTGYMYDNQITLDYSNSNDDYMEYDYYNNVYDNYGNYNGQYENNSLYRNLGNNRENSNWGINNNASYFNQDTYDDKIIPTHDIMFDDMYVVKNQIFEEQEKLFTFNDIISLIICVAASVVIAFLINQYVAEVTTVKGPSMEYNFHNKDVLVLDRISYKIRKPKRYEVVVFPVKDGNDYVNYIKRIIGLPGEKVYIDVQNSAIYINDKKLPDEKYGWENFKGPGLNVENNNILLGKDEYYVMGDNRNNSQDSRLLKVGLIKRKDFVGRAVFKIAPITSFGLINHDYNDDIRNGKRKAYKLNWED